MAKAIEVRGLGKQYRLNARQERADTLRDVLSQQWRRWREAGRGTSNGHGAQSFWALDDVSFDVEAGEVLGVIGRNGAGKSTLLKILARITEPTRGEVDLHGRVGSLLEVGTGFHSELSGRENVFLNGAILGMRRREIQRRFDEIVDFSGVEQFIDTPVKRYSSGMYMRLAFAVAAHLETEILLVDEVLAVGDLQFQEKCLGKMSAAAQSGRTVVFVSHNLEAVGRLCARTYWLDQGRIAASGEPKSIIKTYLQHLWTRSASGVVLPPGSPYVGLEVAVNHQLEAGALVLRAPQESLHVRVKITSRAPAACPRVDLAFYRSDALKLFAVQSEHLVVHAAGERRLQWIVDFQVSDLGLASQDLYFDLGIRVAANAEYAVLWPRVAEIRIENSNAAPLGLGSIVGPAVQVSVG